MAALDIISTYQMKQNAIWFPETAAEMDVKIEDLFDVNVATKTTFQGTCTCTCTYAINPSNVLLWLGKLQCTCISKTFVSRTGNVVQQHSETDK